MALLRTKSPEEKAAALAEHLLRSRYNQARGALYDAVFEAGNEGGIDPQWVTNAMPVLARETAEAWLALYPNPSDADIKALWEKDLHTFWNRSFWDSFDTTIKDLAQEISVSVHGEVMRLREGNSAPAESREAVGSGLGPSWSNELRGAIDSLSSNRTAPRHGDIDATTAPLDSPEPDPIGVSRAIEVWRWANAEQLSDSARSRLDRVARLVSANDVGSQEIGQAVQGDEIRFDQTKADMQHARQMVQFVAQWMSNEPDKFESALGLYLDGGGADDGFGIADDS